MALTEPTSPTVWRRWLAFELVRLRKAAGLDQKDAAKALRCTVGKVSYYEKAERPVVVRDLDEVLLPLYGVPEDRWGDYLDAARNSRQKGWWERYDSTALPSWFSLHVGLVQGATQVRIHAALLVPGLLQTPGYAEATFRRGPEPLADEEIDRRVELRMGRQDVLDREPEPPRLAVVLDEAVLRRRIGDSDVMCRQLAHLAEQAQRPNVTIQVVPFDHGYHPGLISEFQILGFPWPTDTGVVYVEHRAGALYLEQPYEIEAHVVAFEHASLRALPPDDSVALIRTVAKELR